MPLKPPQPPPQNQRDWDQWSRAVVVTPNDATVTTDKIVDGAVTNDKLRNSAAVSVIGNPSASPATPQDIAASADGQFLRRSGGGLAFAVIADGDVPSTIARDTEVAAAVAAHEAAVDPHPGYTTAAELSTAITAHEALTDPHPVYPRAADAESIAGRWVFTGTSSGSDFTLTLDSASPGLMWRETDQGSNAKYWRDFINGGVRTFQVIDDAYSASADWLTVSRSSAAIGTVAFPTATAAAMLIGTASALSYSTATVTIAGASVHGAILSTGTNTLFPAICWNRATSGNNSFIEFDTEGTLTARGSITYNRAGGLVAYNTTSDERLKTNIQDAPDCGDLIDRIRIRSFDWKESGAHVDHWVIAQELEEVLPITVTKPDNPDAMWSVDLTYAVAPLIKEVQSLRKRVLSLEARLAELEARL